MEELGLGGFMGIQDIQPDMKIAVEYSSTMRKKEYIGEVISCKESDIYVKLKDMGSGLVDKKAKHETCKLRIVVDNVLYFWEDVNIFASDNVEGAEYKLTVDIVDFSVLGNENLEGRIIRLSNNDGEYIVGCRMPEDNDEIREYISKNYSE